MTIWQYVCTFAVGLAVSVVVSTIIILIISLTGIILETLDRVKWIRELGVGTVIWVIVVMVGLTCILGDPICISLGWCGY